MTTRYEIETTVTSIRSEKSIARGWKKPDGTSEFEYHPEEWIVSTGYGLSFICKSKPTYEAGAPIKLVVEVG